MWPSYYRRDEYMVHHHCGCDFYGHHFLVGFVYWYSKRKGWIWRWRFLWSRSFSGSISMVAFSCLAMDWFSTNGLEMESWKTWYSHLHIFTKRFHSEYRVDYVLQRWLARRFERSAFYDIGFWHSDCCYDIQFPFHCLVCKMQDTIARLLGSLFNRGHGFHSDMGVYINTRDLFKVSLGPPINKGRVSPTLHSLREAKSKEAKAKTMPLHQVKKDLNIRST